MSMVAGVSPAAVPAGAVRAAELTIGGMTRASCAARVEKKLNKLDGVGATVNFATGTAQVSFPAEMPAAELISVVEQAGYTAALPAPPRSELVGTAAEEDGADETAVLLRQRLLLSLALAIPVVALAMIPPLQFRSWQWACLALASPVAVWGAWPFHRAAVAGARHGAATMDTLVSVGVTAAYLWSVYALFFGAAGRAGMRMSFAWLTRGSGTEAIYLDVASGVTVLILFGRYREARAKRRAGAALRALLSLGARDAAVLRDGREVRIPVEQLAVGEEFIVRPGEKIAAGLLAAVAVLAGCGTPRAPVTAGVVKVVAGENFWGNIAAQIGGPHVQVTSILSSLGADPHLYEADVASALAVAQARLVIANGAGYDDFMSQLLGATVNAGRIALSVQAVLGVYGPDVNPHFWYDIPRVPQVAAAIEAALARLDPPDATVFAGNLAAFDASLRPVEAVIASIRRRHPGAPVAYTERVPGYLLQAAGLTVVTPPGFAAAIENGNDPSPGDTAQMFRLITGHEAAVLLYNAQATSPVTQQVRALARQAGVPVVAVTETMPPSFRSYQAWQLAQATALLDALGG